MIEFDREELAWAGGFFTARGSIGCYRAGSGTHRVALRVMLCTSDELALERFRKALRLDEMPGVSHVQTSAKQRTPRVSICRYETTQAVFAAIWPYLTPTTQTKVRQAFKKFHAQPHDHWSQLRHGSLRWMK